MKELNCAASRREVEESDIAQQLSAAANAHLRDCAKCRDFYESRQKLREMVRNLETVEAPADFNFRVRARIAGERVDAVTGPAAMASAVRASAATRAKASRLRREIDMRPPCAHPSKAGRPRRDWCCH